MFVGIGIGIGRNRYGTGGTPAKLLDDYSGAAAAYSLRKLRTAYTGDAIRVRRSSDNTEQDIGFVDGELDTSTLTTFCSGTNGFVTTWYDQSGNGRDATQSTASEQPQIVSSGSVITDNGKPSIDFDKNGPQYLNTGTQIGLANTGSIYVVSSIASTNQFSAQFSNGYNEDIWVGSVNNSRKLQIWTNNRNSQNTTDIFVLNTQFLASYFMKSGTDGHKIYVNNSIYLTSSQTFTIPNPTATNGGIGRDVYNDDFPFDGKMQEILFFADNTDADNSGINTNINDFYTIYYVATNSEYQDVLDYADSQGYQRPSYAQCALQDALVSDLKDAGVWSKLDLLYVFATDGDSDFACINWKDPNNFECTEVNSPTFTTNKGFESDGSSAYLDTNWSLANDSDNYQQDDAGIFIGVTDQSNISQSQNRYTGVIGTNYNGIRVDDNSQSGNNRSWVNSTSDQRPSYDTKVNNTIYFANRTATTSTNSRNTDLATPYTNSYTGNRTSSTLLSNNQTFFASSGSYASAGNRIGISGFGSNFSSSEMDDIETAWYTNYYTNL